METTTPTELIIVDEKASDKAKKTDKTNTDIVFDLDAENPEIPWNADSIDRL